MWVQLWIWTEMDMKTLEGFMLLISSNLPSEVNNGIKGENFNVSYLYVITGIWEQELQKSLWSGQSGKGLEQRQIYIFYFQKTLSLSGYPLK